MCALKHVHIASCFLPWFWRNKKILDDAFMMPFDIVMDIRSMVDFYFTSLKLQKNANINSNVLAHTGWEPAGGDRIVINVNGVSKSNSRARYGGMICDTRGRWLGGLSKNIGRCNSLRTEL